MATSALLRLFILGISLLLKCDFSSAHEQKEDESRSMFLYKLIGDWYELQYENQMMAEKIKMLEGNQESLDTPAKDHTGGSAYAFNAQWVQNESPSVGDTLIFSRVPLNQNGVYSSTTGEYTVPVDGTYMFSTTICIFAGRYVKIKILADDTVMHLFFPGYLPNEYICTSTSTTGQLQKGMKVKIVVNSKSGTELFSQRNNDRMCTFSGFLIK